MLNFNRIPVYSINWQNGQTNLWYLSISFLLYYVYHIPSVSMQLTGDASIHTWLMMAVNYTETSLSVMGQTRQKIKTQRERCCDRTHSMSLLRSAAWSGYSCLPTAATVLARLASAPFCSSSLTQSACFLLAAMNSGVAPLKYRTTARVFTTSNLSITNSHALISGKKNSQAGLT